MTMPKQKTIPTRTSVASFLAGVTDAARRKDCETLVNLMAKATGQQPVMWGPSIVGFGAYHYKYASGHEGDACLVGFSPRKTDLTLYIQPGLHRYPDLLKRLGKYRSGKSCLYLKSLAEVDGAVLEELVVRSVVDIKAMARPGEK
jgi:hypothetical protein